MKRFFELFVLVLFIACSEPFSFDLPNSTLEVVDGQVSTRVGESYVDIYRLDNDKRTQMKDFDVYVISGDGAIYDFIYKEDLHSYRPTDSGFSGEVGGVYKMIAAKSGEVLFESSYDTIPEKIDFDVQLKDTLAPVFFENTTSIVEKKTTEIFAEIPLSKKSFYSRLKFSYQIDDYFVPGDSLYASDHTKYALYKSTDDLNDGNKITVRVGERLIDKYFVFINSSCSSAPRRLLTSNVLPYGVTAGVPGPCSLYEEFWKMTYEVSLESMSESTYNYWENIQKLSSNDGLIFDVYPFPLIGNITCNECENEVLGNFRAVSESLRKEDWGE